MKLRYWFLFFKKSLLSLDCLYSSLDLLMGKGGSQVYRSTDVLFSKNSGNSWCFLTMVVFGTVAFVLIITQPRFLQLDIFKIKYL